MKEVAKQRVSGILLFLSPITQHLSSQGLSHEVFYKGKLILGHRLE